MMPKLKIQRRPKWDGFRSAHFDEEDPLVVEGRSAVEDSPVNLTPRLENILAATDLSIGGTAAVNAGGALAGRTGAKLAVVSVVEPPKFPELSNSAEPGVAEWVDSLQDKARWKLEIELEEAELRSALIHVSVGDPARLVAGFVESFHSDLVVVGAHRFSSFERILAGSTGEQIIRYSGCPVMVATRDGSGPFKRILVAVDLSRNSQAVLDTAVLLAQCDGSEVRVVNSEEPSKSLGRRITFRDHRALQQSDRQRFEGLVQNSGFSEQPQAIVLHGSAGRAVLRQAREWDADLIVMGARRFSLLFPTRLGRTSRYVLRHGDRSIIVVPT
jgi:nucleotide-binding universal stress UspA family protein